MSEEIYTPPVGAFYVYVYWNPLKGNEPFYVGKGKASSRSRSGQRALDHLYETASTTTNPHKLNTIAKIKTVGLTPAVTLAYETCDEGKAFWIEKFLIAMWGRGCDGGVLTNLTKGGQGPVGRIVSPETRKKLSDAHMGKTLPPERVAKMKGQGLGRKLSPEHREKVVAALRRASRSPESYKDAGKKIRGISLTEEHRKKLSAAKKGKPRGPRPPEVGRKVNKAMKGRTFSPEHRAKLSLAQTGKKQSPEQIEKRRQTQLRNRLAKLKAV